MEEVIRGAGDVNFKRSGDAGFDMVRGAPDSAGEADRSLGGVSDGACSVVGINESWASWYCGA